jgi:hypothetical protein
MNETIPESRGRETPGSILSRGRRVQLNTFLQYIKFSSAVKKVRTGIYNIIILPAVLYGCETWSLTLRKEHRLRVFENRVLRRISGPREEEVR